MHGWMDDYAALAQRISVSVPEVRGCMILSRDGMVLGAFPDDDESLAKAAWLRFITLGEPERSFVEFADQTWAFVRRGPYAAFAVAEAGVRPGVMVDQLEQAMLTAEEGRTRRDTLRVPDAANAPSGKPRTSLHPGGGKDGKDGKEGKGKDKDRDRSKPVEVAADGRPGPGRMVPWHPGDRGRRPGGSRCRSVGRGSAARCRSSNRPPRSRSRRPRRRRRDAPPAPDVEPATALKKEPQKLIGTGSGGDEEETEVDRVLLAKEFSGLLQLDSGDDEGSS